MRAFLTSDETRAMSNLTKVPEFQKRKLKINLIKRILNVISKFHFLMQKENHKK